MANIIFGSSWKIKHKGLFSKTNASTKDFFSKTNAKAKDIVPKPNAKGKPQNSKIDAFAKVSIVAKNIKNVNKAFQNQVKKEKNMLLSLVVPCYNEEGNVTEFYSEATRVLKSSVDELEIIFIDDGSRDGTLTEIKELSEKSAAVRGISFSRNFGKEAAMLAGLRAARGDLVCIIDADLQQRPEVVLDMLRELDSDPTLDCVAAFQDKRGEGKLISFLKSSFYKLINKLSDVRFVNGASDFRLMRRNMVDAIISLTEYNRFTKGIFGYVGFKTKFIPFTHEPRRIGKTKWGLAKLFRYAFDGIIAFTTAPLKLSMIAGLISTLASIIYFIVNLCIDAQAALSASSGIGIISLILFIGGIQLIALGILSEYVGKMQTEVKHRPLYFIKETLEPTLTAEAEESIITADIEAENDENKLNV